MIQQRYSDETLVQNLQDAGCDPSIQQCFMEMYSNGQTDDLLRLLSVQRHRILAAIHENQEQLDTLDYLAYKLRKTSGKGI